MKITYVPRNFRKESRILIDLCDEILLDYHDQGLKMTVRQLYYQLVARNIIENTEKSYNRIKNLISNARLAGEIHWNMIEDKTRRLQGHYFNSSLGQALQSASDCFALDLWKGQEYRVQVWVEKQALAGIIERATDKYQVPFFSCRGFASQTSQWELAQSMIWEKAQTVIIHLGDHDPSGIDMTRDIIKRMGMFTGYRGRSVQVHRIALNWDQLEEYKPPPNPAKETDSRAKAYIEKFKTKSSWELDALDPNVLDDLICDKIEEFLDKDMYEDQKQKQEEQQEELDELILRSKEDGDYDEDEDE